MMMVDEGGTMPNLSISDHLSSLPKLSKQELAQRWRALFETNPPLRMRKDLMIQFVAYHLQEQEFGVLSHISQRHLRELASRIDADSGATRSHRPPIKPGTRLIREWKGHVHVVNVEERTYEYKGCRYDSLSEIARLITGTRWSGPLFFGLKTKPKELVETR